MGMPTVWHIVMNRRFEQFELVLTYGAEAYQATVPATPHGLRSLVRGCNTWLRMRGSSLTITLADLWGAQGLKALDAETVVNGVKTYYKGGTVGGRDWWWVYNSTKAKYFTYTDQSNPPKKEVASANV